MARQRMQELCGRSSSFWPGDFGSSSGVSRPCAHRWLRGVKKPGPAARVALEAVGIDRRAWDRAPGAKPPEVAEGRSSSKASKALPASRQRSKASKAAKALPASRQRSKASKAPPAGAGSPEDRPAILARLRALYTNAVSEGDAAEAIRVATCELRALADSASAERLTEPVARFRVNPEIRKALHNAIVLAPTRESREVIFITARTAGVKLDIDADLNPLAPILDDTSANPVHARLLELLERVAELRTGG